MYHYDCFGLSIASELVLPIPVRDSGETVADTPFDVTITALPPPTGSARGAAPHASTFAPLADIDIRDFDEHAHDAGGARYLPTGGGVLVRVRGSCDLYATSSRIVLRGEPGLSDADLGDLAARVALGFVLQLRGILSLHGAAVSRSGGVLAIVGERGTGKSTASMALAARGFGMLSDDVVAIDAGLFVRRGLYRSRLNDDSLERLRTDMPLAEAPRDRDGKHAVDGPLVGEAAPLRLIVALEISDEDRVASRELKGYAKLQAALRHIHAPEGVGSMADRFAQSAGALASIPLYVMTRPIRRFALTELIDAIDALYAEGCHDGAR